MLCSKAPEALWGKVSPINLDILEGLRLQQEIEDAHNNKVAYDSWPVWDSVNCTASTDVIKQHFCQIHGMDGALCAYLMHKHIILSPVLGTTNFRAKSFDNQMIKCYPIIKSLDLLSNLPAPDVEPPLKFHAHKTAEDSA